MPPSLALVAPGVSSFGPARGVAFLLAYAAVGRAAVAASLVKLARSARRHKPERTDASAVVPHLDRALPAAALREMRCGCAVYMRSSHTVTAGALAGADGGARDKGGGGGDAGGGAGGPRGVDSLFRRLCQTRRRRPPRATRSPPAPPRRRRATRPPRPTTTTTRRARTSASTSS